jgi:predicted transcriptional regulator
MSGSGLTARREAGVTQTELARQMGTSQAAIARLEGGKVKPTWETVERYAKALGRRPVVTLVAAE